MRRVRPARRLAAVHGSARGYPFTGQFRPEPDKLACFRDSKLFCGPRRMEHHLLGSVTRTPVCGQPDGVQPELGRCRFRAQRQKAAESGRR